MQRSMGADRREALMLFFTSAASIDIWAYGASELAEKHDANQPESGGSDKEIFKSENIP